MVSRRKAALGAGTRRQPRPRGLGRKARGMGAGCQAHLRPLRGPGTGVRVARWPEGDLWKDSEPWENLPGRDKAEGLRAELLLAPPPEGAEGEPGKPSPREGRGVAGLSRGGRAAVAARAHSGLPRRLVLGLSAHKPLPARPSSRRTLPRQRPNCEAHN